jgi:diacylglycerol kinase (ATP)
MSGPIPEPASGARRLLNALRYSCSGFRHAVRHQAALRQELVLLAVLTPVSLVLRISPLEKLALVLSLLLVILVEFLNTAIEAAVDRISTERHPLAGLAKDLGSAAVLVSLVMAAAAWAVIAGPPLFRSIQSGLRGP